MALSLKYCTLREFLNELKNADCLFVMLENLIFDLNIDLFIRPTTNRNIACAVVSFLWIVQWNKLVLSEWCQDLSNQTSDTKAFSWETYYGLNIIKIETGYFSLSWKPFDASPEAADHFMDLHVASKSSS